MFTGIVEAKGLISKKIPSAEGQRLQIEVPEGFNKDLKEGASVAVNGVCLTVTEYSNNQISFAYISVFLIVVFAIYAQQKSSRISK